MNANRRSLLTGALLCVAALAGCNNANGKLNILDTKCVSIIAVTGAGGGEAGSIEISAVKASVKDLPACAGKKICKFEYSIFADRNGNGMEDTGENVLGNTWTDPSGAGTTKASVGGGQVTWGPASGTLRYTAVVTFCDDTKGSTKGVVSVN